MASNTLIKKLKLDEIEEITKAFRAFDENQNGSITPAEMRECLRRSKIPYQDVEIDRVISSMDSNEDGAVSFEEYMDFMAHVYTGNINQFQVGQSSKSKQRSKKK
jgi:Ca2+-binding EF-hand superfamily protein